jgi:hypothetical protein
LIAATGRVLPRQWGTEIDVHCSYSAGEHYAYRYRLVVVDREKAQHPAGDWALVPGQSSLDFRAGTSVAIDQISSIEITAENGTPLLQLAR